jgi:hypothetical protein
MCDVYREDNRLIHYEPTSELTWEEANTLTACKRCGKSNEFRKYVELRQEAIEANDEELEDWTEVYTTDSDLGYIVGFECQRCEISYSII